MHPLLHGRHVATTCAPVAPAQCPAHCSPDDRSECVCRDGIAENARDTERDGDRETIFLFIRVLRSLIYEAVLSVLFLAVCVEKVISPSLCVGGILSHAVTSITFTAISSPSSERAACRP